MSLSYHIRLLLFRCCRTDCAKIADSSLLILYKHFVQNLLTFKSKELILKIAFVDIRKFTKAAPIQKQKHFKKTKKQETPILA